MDTCCKKAYAKINLGLDVIGRLPNGYHEVKMVMQTVDIYDEIFLEKADGGIALTVSREDVGGKGTEAGDGGGTDACARTPGELPADGDNLAVRAARLMLDEFAVAGGVRIHLRKRIPIAAGMAGGSTDAAATMKGINELFGLGVPEEKLRELGVRIGADVPYCIMGGTALAEGIGEKLTRLSPAPRCVLLVAKPDVSVSTKYVYEHLDAGAGYPHPDIDGMVAAIGEGDLEGVAGRLGNVLESVTVEACPVIAVIKERMLQGGALGSLMSGSGPTVFGIFSDSARAEAVARQIGEEKLAGQIFVTGFAGE